MSTNQDTHTNRLINETSPYLRQHAENPVDWFPWGKEALKKAKEENKPILLSIGYSSCHWCHVMAHESFENDSIATYMNEHFVNIKLDREERPDIDQVYMEAIQNMGLRGGWPLNVFLTPDQKPFYGGTYFPPGQWKKLLENITEAYNKNYDKLSESADRFAEAMQQSEVSKYGIQNMETPVRAKDFDPAFDTLSKKFDHSWGGIQKAPKFPMPSLWEFLAGYYDLSGNKKALNHLLFTLDKMAAGGIYDQIGGGFSRYSVDGEWHVPHFEKMLYDNGQLLSLYATGYKLSPKDTYYEVLLKTAEWLEMEMMSKAGGFYSALDADSEGEEGKFYVWTFEEVKNIAGEHFSLIAEYYDVTKEGNWEGKNVLRRLETDQQLAQELNLEIDSLRNIVEKFDKKALDVRNNRVRPGLDDKIISGWNGLILAGLCDAYQATGKNIFLDLATRNAAFIKEHLVKDNGLLRIYQGETMAFLEDYGAIIKGFLNYYETTFDEDYLHEANRLTKITLKSFFDEEEGFFYYTSDRSEELIARKKEIFDNVIPSSNSLMAHNLYRLGTMLGQESYKEKASSMVRKVNHMILQEPEYLSNWGVIALMMAKPTSEVVIIGDSAYQKALEIQRSYLPNKVVLASKKSSDLSLLSYKEPIDGKTTIFVCYNKTCKRPVFEIKSAIREIKSFSN